MNRRPVLTSAFLLLASAVLLAQEAAPPPPKEAPAKAPDPLAVVDELMREVEKARGLTFKEPFARKVLSPEEVGKLAVEMTEKEYPEEKLAGFTRLYSRLGFFSPELRLADTFGTMMEAGAGGLYDPETKTLYLVAGFSAESSRPILFHELVHALEDQYLSLDERMREFEDDSDRAAGVRAVVEGSAQYFTKRYSAEHPEVERAMMADAMKMMRKQMEMLAKVPLVLIVPMGIYPYGNGPAFVAEKTGGDPEKIAALYADPPASTEQVLHPEKYGPDGDAPVRVTLPDLGGVLPEGWTGPFEDTIGELQLGVLLNEFAGGPSMMKVMRLMTMDERVAFRGEVGTACEGWDGDRAGAWTDADGRVGVVWASRWDRPEDATEFAAAYEKGFDGKKRSFGLPPTRRIEVRDDRVMVVEGFPEDLLEKVAKAAWKGTKFEE